MSKTKAVISLFVLVLLNGCATTKIVVPSYTAPAEYKKLSEIKSGGEENDGVYLTLAIDPDISGDETKDKKSLGKNLISSIKGGITETNFITLYPFLESANVQLNMDIASYDFTKTDTDINSELQVTFTITKGTTEYLSKTYSAAIKRHSSTASLLPSKNQIIQEISQRVADEFIADITPVKTNQLREFKSMPSELDYILTYAKRGNFESAITDMEAYEGEESADFYYNLAVLYEALGSKTGDIKLFVKADAKYRQAMQSGGSDDELIINTRARFDNFFRMFKMTEEQRETNKTLANDLNEIYGSDE